MLQSLRTLACFYFITKTRVLVLGDIPFENFAQQLLGRSDGKFPTESSLDLNSIPSVFFCVLVPSLKLMRHVFLDISNKYKEHHWLCERPILAPKNENVNKINEIILKKLPGNSITYKSVDSVMDKEQAVYYPTEFFDSLNPPGMPPHMLNLNDTWIHPNYAMGQDFVSASLWPT
ncbi:hypothetical protein AVEN_185944-1 [Araneus ventricosus]|uniref:Uncharacterized protein n=1 Tax=Araneus ventricosus TaxID=182803 RepID=A0A4Y2JFF9_ARAVE|nr:hypothetical protein AVEN_185944-1 [Araneus ventricosus]